MIAKTSLSANSPVFIAVMSLETECGIIKGVVETVGRELLHISVPDATYSEKQNAEGLKNTFKTISMLLVPADFTEEVARNYLERVDKRRGRTSSALLSLPHHIIYGATEEEARSRFSKISAARRAILQHAMSTETISHDDSAEDEIARLRDVIERAHRALSNGRADDAHAILSLAVE